MATRLKQEGAMSINFFLLKLKLKLKRSNLQIVWMPSSHLHFRSPFMMHLTLYFGNHNFFAHKRGRVKGTRKKDLYDKSSYINDALHLSTTISSLLWWCAIAPPKNCAIPLPKGCTTRCSHHTLHFKKTISHTTGCMLQLCFRSISDEIYKGRDRLDFNSHNGGSLANHKLVRSLFRVQFSLSKIQL